MGIIRPEAPRIFDYQDYRIFLADHFAYRKARDPEFSLRVFSRHTELRLASSSFLSAVLKGKKNLSQALRLRFGKALGLEPAEQEYFELLIQANQGKTAEERAHYRSRLGRFHGSRARSLSGAEGRFYGRWWYPLVWHWIGLHPEQGNPARIAKAIRPRIEPAQAEEAVRALLEMKLIKRLANGYAVSDRHLAAGPALGGEAARGHAREYLRMAIEELDRPAPDACEYHLWSFTLTGRGRERLREKLEALRAEVRELAAAPAGAEAAGAGGPNAPGSDAGAAAVDAAGGRRVYALALQVLPCSEAAGTPDAVPARAARPGTSAEIAVLPEGAIAGDRAPEAPHPSWNGGSKKMWTAPPATP
jgi:uncharacterized protein (TIGR02147 family)